MSHPAYDQLSDARRATPERRAAQAAIAAALSPIASETGRSGQPTLELVRAVMLDSTGLDTTGMAREDEPT
jgi:hypothetical protein